MKKVLIIAAFAAFATVAAQAGDTPAILKGIAKKQTLNKQQLAHVRGEGLLCLPAIVPSCGSASCPSSVNANVHANVNVCTTVNANADVNANVNLPGLLSAHVNVPVGL